MKRNEFLPMVTLEQHLRDMRDEISEAEEIYSCWVSLRKRLKNKLQDSKDAFPTFSLHDETHSKSILHSIERFLGEDRINKLSYSDTFLLLCVAYLHDYGMALSYFEILKILDSKEFEDYVKEKYKTPNSTSLDEETIYILNWLLSKWCEKEIAKNNNNSKDDILKKLSNIYRALKIGVQDYQRPRHWKDVEKVVEDFKDLFNNDLSNRLVNSIIDICQMHGKAREDIASLQDECDSPYGDSFHPRWLACMLRLGDLLDIDNNRFSNDFMSNVDEDGMIPNVSLLHYKKHQSIKQYIVRPEKVIIISKCEFSEEGYEVASIVAEWFDFLKNEWEYLTKNWFTITKGEFGPPPGELKLEIFVGQYSYFSKKYDMKLHMNQDKVLDLLRGTNIYQNWQVAVRELIQNAVDASLLQMWKDIKNNVYNKYNLNKDDIKNKDILPKDIPYDIFKNYSINIELICDKSEKQIYLIIKDKGIGITRDDVYYMSNIGSSKEKNPRIKEIMKSMPAWIQPAGIFGIGLQSVFQLTEKIYFYTRLPNIDEKLIIFHSNGKIEIREVKQDDDGIFYDNTPQGTNVKIAINYKKILGNSNNVENFFTYFDQTFDEKNELEAAFIEISHSIKNALRLTRLDYFDITYKDFKINENEEKYDVGSPVKIYSFFREVALQERAPVF